MASWSVDVHLSKAKLTLFLNYNCSLIASNVSDHSLQQMLIRVLLDGSMSLLPDAAYNHHSSSFDIVFHGI